MGIYKNGRGVGHIYMYGYSIASVWTGGRKVWPPDNTPIVIPPDDEILSCYYNGYWMDEYPWTDDTPWTD